MDIIEKTKLELAFEEFNSLMDKYNEEYTSAKDEKEAQKIQDKYEKLMDTQEKSLEDVIEQDFKEAQEEADLVEKEMLRDLELQSKTEELQTEELQTEELQTEEEVLKDEYVGLSVVEMRKNFTKLENEEKARSLGLKVFKSWTEKKICEKIYNEINK